MRTAATRACPMVDLRSKEDEGGEGEPDQDERELVERAPRGVGLAQDLELRDVDDLAGAVAAVVADRARAAGVGRALDAVGDEPALEADLVALAGPLDGRGDERVGREQVVVGQAVLGEELARLPVGVAVDSR